MKKILTWVIGIIVLLLILSSITDKKESDNKNTKETEQSVSTSTKPTKELTSLKNPVIKDSEFFKDAKWGDPSVLKTENGFIMYASAGKGFSGDIDIYRLESKDGISWELNPKNPVLENSTDANAIDKKGVETPSVVIFKGVYHMFYTAYPKDLMEPKEYRIMHATSPDGISWTKNLSPVVSPTDPNNNTPNMDFNQWITAEPGAVVFNNKLYLYFAASGANQITQSDLFTIGLITSNDGNTWSKPKMVLMPDQITHPRKKYQGYSTPGATVHNGKMELFFDVAEANPFTQVAIMRAVSADGETNWDVDQSPLITIADYAWAKTQVVSPSPIYSKDKLYLWFSGHTKYELGIGLFVK